MQFFILTILSSILLSFASAHEVDFESASDLQSDASVSKTLQTFNDLYIQGDFIGALIPLNETETDNPEEMNARNLGYNCDTTAGSPRLHDIDTLVRVVRSLTGCGTDWPYSPRYPCRQVAQVETHVAVSICGPGFESRWNCDRLANTIQGIKNRCAWSRYAGGRYVEIEAKRWVALHK
ncbi:hypothetical protein EDC01DRAFT_633330 [Geopyxis carbonaria]|nr:hypothetical protein EDC01DRAFT_633330 [Geopyxis carbonaria]